MTNPRAELDARIGRILSTVLQGALAQGGDDRGAAAGIAFMTEYEPEIIAALLQGPQAQADLWFDLVTDLAATVYSLTQHLAPRLNQQPAELLLELVRTYRKAGRA